MTFNYLTTTLLASGMALTALTANAATTTDGHGNVGYDSYEECVNAVRSGTAKFYTPYTYQKPMPRQGEASFKQMKLSDVEIPQAALSRMSTSVDNYRAGACDLGVGHSNGRDGVSGVLIGKYVPFSADMPVNVYLNRRGTPVRVTMQQCDNHFGSAFPRPIIANVASPDAQIRINEVREVEAVTTRINRTVRPAYEVKEILVVPKGQLKRVETDRATAVAVQTGRNAGVVLGKEASDKVIERIQPTDKVVPVTVVPPVPVVPNNNVDVIIE